MTKIKPRLIARISCQECRRRKTRCNFDGQSQKCSTCARIGTACIFAQKNGVVLDMDKVMEENNPHLVHQREKEQRAKDRARHLPSSSTSSSASFGPMLAPATDYSLYSKSTPSSSYLSGSHFHSSNNNRPSRSNSISSAAYNPRNSSTEDLSQVMDRLQIDAFGIAPHTLRSFSQVARDNESAETSSGDSSEAESAEPSNFQQDSMEPDQSGGSNYNKPSPILSKRNSSGSNHRSSRSRSVPLVDIQPDLINLYFQHVHPFLLVLHKPSFFRRLHDPKDPVPDFLLAAMYAVASHYAPGREQDGRRYFQLWLSRLDDTLDKPRLSTIQALLMIIKYQEGVKQTGFYFRTYMYTQMVVVLAREFVELQLHKTTPVNAKLDQESHEVRRRLFWSIFVLDQFLSVSQGRAMSFREVEPEADLPRTDNEDPNDPEEIEVIENATEYIKLVKIDHQAQILVRKFLTKVVTPEETIPQGLFLQQAMLSWKANLPTRLQLASNMSPHTPFVAMLHILYHACSIMIQRCYCEDPSVGNLEIAAASRAACTVSATNITVITDDLYTNHGMVPLSYPIRGCYFVIYCLIAAATIQVSDIRHGGNSTIMFKRSVALLNVILRRSTAVDIEREVELLKSSLDSPMGDSSVAASSSSRSNSAHYDHRPPLKPILPMSQKHGSRMSFNGSSVTPVRVRKISPKTTSSSSSSAISSQNTAQNSISGTLLSTDKQAQDESQAGYKATGEASSERSTTTESSASPQMMEDDADVSIKSSPSPHLTSLPITAANNGALDSSSADIVNSDSFLRSVPTFLAPSSLPSDFNAFAMSRQQLGSQEPVPLLSLSQFLTFQQEQQRLQKERQLQQQQVNYTSLENLTTEQIQDHLRLLQQQQSFQMQQRQLEQQQQRQQQLYQYQQDPALVNAFLNNLQNLNNYQQLNSDQVQNDLLSMLDSSTLNSGGSGGNFINNLSGASFLSQQQQQQQPQDRDRLPSSLSPSSESMSSTAFSPDLGSNMTFQNGFSLSDKQRNQSTDESMTNDSGPVGRHHPQQQSPIMLDTPSPEGFTVMDMAGSFPGYLAGDSTLPFGVRQSLGDAEKLFKYQAQANLASDS
ncbi:hypothetical protein BGZ83_003985 [Gryganskiella cystojenkinii]|nr:hypothetical protein BGZ83_003985 [Gryganskiella cystojenkinii]